jgi:glycosyltransferase involved in cell wall biosynthesis
MPPALAAEVFAADSAPQAQTVNFGLNLLAMLRAAFARVEQAGFVPIQDYPRGRRLWFGTLRFQVDGAPCLLLPFVNLTVLKHLTRFASLMWLLLSRRQTGRVVIVHGLHLPYLVFALLAKARGATTGIMITDEQGLAAPGDGALKRFLKGIDGRLARWFTRRADFCLALSDGLAALYAGGKPSFVFPGLAAADAADTEAAPRQAGGTRTILYAGSLAQDYGADLLAQAAALLPDGYEVRILGRGPLVPVIEAAAAGSQRLRYLGFTGRAGVISAMQDADLLINPRPSQTRLAAMSAPSKLIEYAMAGRPVLTTRLPSVTPVMADSLLFIEQEDAAGIAGAIVSAFALGPEALDDLGRRYRSAVAGAYGASEAGRSLAGFVAALPGAPSGAARALA